MAALFGLAVAIIFYNGRLPIGPFLVFALMGIVVNRVFASAGAPVNFQPEILIE
jgi:hypothetical protein